MKTHRPIDPFGGRSPRPAEDVAGHETTPADIARAASCVGRPVRVEAPEPESTPISGAALRAGLSEFAKIAAEIEGVAKLTPRDVVLATPYIADGLAPEEVVSLSLDGAPEGTESGT